MPPVGRFKDHYMTFFPPDILYCVFNGDYDFETSDWIIKTIDEHFLPQAPVYLIFSFRHLGAIHPEARNLSAKHQQNRTGSSHLAMVEASFSTRVIGTLFMKAVQLRKGKMFVEFFDTLDLAHQWLQAKGARGALQHNAPGAMSAG